MIMKKVSLLKPLLLLFALIVGSSSAWADDIESNFTDKNLTVGTGELAWTASESANSFESSGSARGVQFGAAIGEFTLTSNTSLSNISKVELVMSTNGNANANTVSVKVGGTTNFTCGGNTTFQLPKENNQTVTFTGAETNGTIVITINDTHKSVYIKKITVTYSAGAPKSPNELAWSAASKDVTYSETPYNLPTLSNPHGLTIEYSSSNTSVATINSSTGEITIKNVTGSSTISAYTAGDETYAAGTVSYELNVTRKVIVEDGIFDFSLGADYGSGVENGNDIITNTSSTWTAGNIVMTVANRFAWATSNQLKLYKAVTGVEAGKITITCPAGKAITQIEFVGPYSGTGALSNIDANIGTYTVTSSSAIWTGAAQSVSFTASASTYINSITVTYGTNATIAPAKEYTTYVTSVALDFTGVSGLKAFVATAAASTGVTLTEPTAAVPAGTPLVLKKVFGTSFEVPVVASGTAPATNLLKAGPATMTGDGTEYILIDGLFYQSTAGALATGKAYLKTASALGRELTINWGDETAINALENATKIDNGAIYDLSGRRVENPTKGIYIINGKKVIFK